MRTHAILAQTAILLITLASCTSADGTTSIKPTVAPPAPKIATLVLPRGTRGAAYSTKLAASTPAGTGPVVWQLAAASPALPAGIALATDGTLTGTPTEGGLFPLQVVANNSVGGTAVALLDVVIYEAIGYAHGPDMYDTPSNDTLSTATVLGVVGSTAPLVQTTPLSVTSNPADPNPDPSDYFAFTTTVRGEIRVAVYFSAFVGKLKAALYGEHNGSLELVQQGITGTGGDDQLVVLPDAPAGTWVLHVEAQFKNGTWNANGYTFRIEFSDLTIGTGLVEYDRQTGTLSEALPATAGGVSAAGATWALASGTLPAGVGLSAVGILTGNPQQNGLFDVDLSVSHGGLTARRVVQLRVFDSAAGDYWQRLGEHRCYDAARPYGDGTHHEHYCEAMVVAPHPAYGAEGAIYVIGGRTAATVNTVFVFHTAHQADANRNYKLEDIGCPLPNERQYVGAAYLLHSYGGYIYAVGGELYSNTSPSTGAFTRVVERMQVADGAGNALAVPGNWQPVANLPGDDAGRIIEGFAEFSLVAVDAANDSDDRLYLLGGRRRIESSAGSGSFTKDFNTRVHMYEAPLATGHMGAWHIKPEAAPFTPRRFAVAGMIGGRIYMAGGRTGTAATDIIEMYEPDSLGINPAVALAGASAFPRLSAPAWYSAGATHNGGLYVLNGWDHNASPQALRSLQRFIPGALGLGGTVTTLTAPDTASGFHSAVFHDDRLWFITGRDPVVPTPRFNQSYKP
ncbi:MAG: putative Ig domain-containing protein [Planctomycetes bacterium]|nr:putative Ig domain-containing protein [Planctomycetota bacterium]